MTVAPYSAASRSCGCSSRVARVVAQRDEIARVARGDHVEPRTDRVGLEHVVELDDLDAECLERGERGLADAPHLVVERGVAERRGPADPGRELRVDDGVEPGRLGARQRGEVVLFGADDGVEREGDVRDAPGHRPFGREREPPRRDGAAGRHAAEGGLEPRQTAQRRGDPDGAPAVGARGERHHARGDGGGRAARGPAGGVLEVPGVARGAEDRVGRARRPAVLGSVRLADDDAAGAAQPRDEVRVAHRRCGVGLERRAVRRREPGRVLQVLHPDRHPGERAGVRARGEEGVHGGRLLEGALGVRRHEGVDLPVALLDRAEGRLGRRCRRHLAVAHATGDLGDGERPEVHAEALSARARGRGRRRGARRRTGRSRWPGS